MKIKNKKTLVKIFEPSSEKIFVATIPFLPIIPIMLYVLVNSVSVNDGAIWNFFHLTAFVSYSFISLFAIPFEGVLGYMGMMDFGGGIFNVGFEGMNFAGIVLVQFIYAFVFYAVCSVMHHIRKMTSYSYERK